MKKIFIAGALLLILAGAAAPCRAEALAGGDPLAFLFLDAGGRPAALGGAYTALARDSNALLYNPAGLGRIKQDETTFMHNSYFQGINQEYIGMATRQGFGLNLNYVGYGQISRTTISQPNSTLGAFGASDMAFTMGYGHEFNHSLSLGFGLKLLRENIDNYTATAYAADLGAMLPISPIPRLTLGVSLQNIGPQIKYQGESEQLPLAVRAGVAYGLTLGETENTVTVDMLKERTGNYVFSFGGESIIYKMMAARGGFSMSNDAGLGITAGLGWNIGNMSIDYAIVPYGNLGLTNRVSATIRWGAKASDEYRSKWSGQTAKKEPPDSPEAHFARAEEHRKAGYYSLATKELGLAAAMLSEKDQRMVFYHEQMGYISWLKNDFGEAKGHYQDGLKLAMDLSVREPVVADVYAGLGMCEMREGNAKYALELFTKGLEAHPSPKTKAFIQKEINRLSK